MLTKIAHAILLILAPLMMLSPIRSGTEKMIMFLCALVGKGGGSGWDSGGQTQALVNNLVARSEMIVFDIGANNGLWALSLYDKIKTQAPVFHLFECAPYCFTPLAHRATEIPNAFINHVAVSDQIGEIELFIPEIGSGLASVHMRGDTSVSKHEYEAKTVPTTTIDSYIATHEIDYVDVLKIDVEGHELAVLHGAKGAFSNKRIGTVMFEFGSANVNSRTHFRDFWHFFTDYNYKIRRVIPGGKTIAIDKYADEHEYFRGCSNYLAIPKAPRRI